MDDDNDDDKRVEDEVDDLDLPTIRVLKENVIFDSKFIVGNPCPLEESETVQLHREPFPASLSANDLAKDIAAMFNTGNGGRFPSKSGIVLYGPFFPDQSTP